ncbi:MAG: proprotein convertase P-domain-containing protein, partial [Chitinophagales bacterium]|nr:proprotein convertase P-domain-containing protein [Chitinophagales bacterium]
MMRKNFTFLGSMVLGLLCFSQMLFAQTTTVSFSSTGAAVSIPDDGYNGTLASMAQKTATVTGIPTGPNITIDAITINMNASHTWIGDLTIKLVAPNGSVMGIMSRPGLAETIDDGSNCCGASDDLTGATITFSDAATTSAENMGLATATTVGSDGVFSFSPDKGSIVSPYTTFASMATTLGAAGLNGTWTLAAGDAGLTDVGTLSGFTINVTYTVNIPCVLTCPSNVTMNLAGGECSRAYSYAVNYTGNCNVLVQAPASVTQNVNTTTIDDALDCSAFVPTSQWRAYSNPTQFTINSVTTASFFAGTVQAFVYTYTGAVGAATLNTAQMTLVGQSNATAVGGQAFTTLNLVAPAVIPAGTNYVVELRKTAGGGFAVAGNYLGETAPSYITCPTAGITTPTSYGSLGFGFIHVIQIVNGTTSQSVPPTLVQTSGLASGEEFPIGTTTNCFELRNPVTGAVVQSCCFNVVVNEYANPITSLICNDHVNISLDENCTTTIGADQILEGGPYGCYDDYIVELDKSAPFGNGPWLSSTVGAGDVGKTYQVRVTDPTTGNKCWGTVKIEDKFAPVLSCPAVTIPCNYPSTPGAVSSLAPVSFASSSISIIDVGTATASIPVNVGAAPVLKVTVGISTNHTWVGDLSMTVTNPSGTQTVVFDRPGNGGCAGNGLEVTFDDGAANTYAQFNGTCGNNPAIAGTYQSLGGLAQLNSGNLNGNWTVSIADAVGGDTGNATVTITLVTAAPIPFPNGVAAIPTGATSFVVPAGTGTPVMEYCSDVTLSYIDSESQRDCASGLTKVISRKWTARDASGNTTVCTQTINVLRPQLSDISLPPDYDGIDAPAFTCGSAYPTPTWIQGQGLQGFPEIWGVPSGCSINWEYDDQVLDVCDGTYKIRRDWTIIDWCTGTGFEYTQLLKVLDEVGPSIECPANLTVSVDPFNCCATVDLPDAIIADECSRINNISAMVTTFDPQTGAQTGMYVVGGSLTTFPGNNLWTPDTLGRYGVTTCLPMGTHTVVYMAEDDCGNTSTCSFRLTVRDWI